MPYIGRELDRGNYLKLDDISSSFDGSTTTFNLTNGGNAFYPGSAFSILVVLAGVVQEPEAAYQINQTQITFASAPLAGDQFFCIVLGQALGVNTPANGSVNGAQLAKPFNYDNYFYLDDANNRVGVGTATPMTPLHVEGTGRFTNVTVTGDLTVEGTTSTLDTVVTEVDKLEVGANNSTVGVAITQSGSGDAAIFMGGNVGINKASPSRYLEIGGTSNNPQIRLSNGAGTSSLEVLGNAASGQEIRFGTEASPQAGRIIYHNNDNSLRYSNPGGERVRITSDGKIGINDATPVTKLVVRDTLQTTANNHYSFIIKGDDNGTNGESAHIFLSAIDASTRGVAIGAELQSSSNNHDLVFKTSNISAAPTEKVRITNTGKVGIGSDNPQSMFEVYGSSPIVRSKHKTSQKYTQIHHDGTDGYLDWSSGTLAIRGGSNAERIRIGTTGTVGLCTASPAARFHIHAPSNDLATIRLSGTAGSQVEYDIRQGIVGVNNAGFSIRDITNSATRLAISSDGKVGVGADSPLNLFHVKGANTIARFQSTTSYVDLMFQNTGATNGFIQYGNAGDFKFYANSGSTPTLTIKSGSPGNVGIGEDSPDVRLHVKEQFDTAYSLTSVTSDSNHLLKLENPSTTANAFSGMQFRVGSGADLYFGAIQQNVNDGDFFFANQNSPQREMMRIKSTGKVGIGTNDPSSPLHLQSTSANQSVLTISANNGRAANIRSPQVSDSNTPFTFYTNNAWRFDIDSIRVLTMTHDYKVGIKTDVPLSDFTVHTNDNGYFSVNGSGGNGAELLFHKRSDKSQTYSIQNNGGANELVQHVLASTSGEYSWYIGGQSASNLKMRLTSGGDVGIGTATPDKKLRVEGDARVTGTLTIGEASTVIDGNVDYPTIRPTLDLNFAVTKVLDDRITFTRNSVGTYIDENRVLKYASNNVPRFDHDFDTGESLGLLIEESRTNLAEYGTIVGGTGWYNRPTFTTTLNDSVAPDGRTTATKITSLNVESDADLYSYEQYSIGSNKTITHSIYIKSPDTANVGKEIHFRGKRIGGTTSSWGQKFILTAEWQRVTVTHTYQSDNTTGRAYIGSDPNSSHPAGEATACLFWGLQVEEGSFATSFIPTYGSTVTRAADFATIKGTNFTDFYNQTEGTLFGEFTIKDIATSSAAIVNINQEPGSSYAYSIMFVEIGTAAGYFGRTFKNSSGQGLSNGSSVANLLHPSTTPQTVSFGYTSVSGGELRAYWNGNYVNSSSVTSYVPTTLTNMRIGRGWGGTDTINAHIRKLSYYPKRLPDAQLQGLTQQ